MIIQRAVLHGARDLRFAEESVDEQHPLFVQTLVTALSTGTDLGNYEGRSTEVPGAPDYPRGVGYSNVGIVKATGQRVFSMRPHQSGFIATEKDLLVPVPDGVDASAASLAYLTQLGVASLRQVHYEAGESVCVIGLGVIGLATVAVARAMGARVTYVANSPFRAKLAEELGGVASDGEADIVVLTANPWKAYKQALETARYGGRITVLGFPGRAEAAPDFNPLDARWFYAKQLTLVGAGFSPRTAAPAHELRFNLARNLEMIFDYMRRGELPLEKIITHRYPWHQMRDAYELALAHSKEMAAAVFEWDAASPAKNE